MKLQQADLFDPPPSQPASPRLVSVNAKEARKRGPRLSEGEVDARVLADIAGNSKIGRTRNELAERLGLSVQTLCWSIGRLLKARKVFRRALTAAGYYEVVYDDVSAFGKRPKYDSRGGCYLLYGELYRDFWQSASMRRSA